jgi:hypothetical protein
VESWMKKERAANLCIALIEAAARCLLFCIDEGRCRRQGAPAGRDNTALSLLVLHGSSWLMRGRRRRRPNPAVDAGSPRGEGGTRTSRGLRVVGVSNQLERPSVQLSHLCGDCPCSAAGHSLQL